MYRVFVDPCLLLMMGVWCLSGCRDRELDELEQYHRFATQQANPQLQRFGQSLQYLQQTKDLEKLRLHVQQRMLPELSKYMALLQGQSTSIRSAGLKQAHLLLIQAYREIQAGLTSFAQEAQDETQRIKWVIALRQKAQQFEQQEQRYHRDLRAWIQHVQRKP